MSRNRAEWDPEKCGDPSNQVNQTEEILTGKLAYQYTPQIEAIDNPVKPTDIAPRLDARKLQGSEANF